MVEQTLRNRGGSAVARVVIVAPEELPVPPSRGGSVQIYLDGLVRKLHQSGSNILLISPGKRVPENLPILHINGSKKLYQTKVIRVLRRLSPDLVQIDNRPELVQRVKRVLPNAKVVLNLHSNTFLSTMYISPSQARLSLKHADAVVVNSEYLKNWIRRRFRLSSSSWNPIVIYPGIETKRFQPKQLPDVQTRTARSTGNPFQPLRVLFVGRVIRQKGVHVLVSAVKYLRNQLGIPIQVTLVGRTPPWETRYGKSIRSSLRHLPIRRAGFVPPAQLPRYYWNADVLVCPSQWREAFGLVNVEAMAAGLPVIASNVGGIKEVVDSSCGILVKDYHNPKAFAMALRKLAMQPSLRGELSRGAIQRARQFTWEEAARQFQTLYTRLV